MYTFKTDWQLKFPINRVQNSISPNLSSCSRLMWSPWISVVIMSLWLLLSLSNYSGGTYIFISLDLIKILSCRATLFFFFFNICIFPPAIKQAYGYSTLHNGRDKTGHRGHTSWGVITHPTGSRLRLPVSVCLVVRHERRCITGKIQGETEGKLTNFWAHPMTVKLLQVIYFPSASIWWYTAGVVGTVWTYGAFSMEG